jgi:hypothetical protein
MQGMCTAEHLALTDAARGNTTRRLKNINTVIYTDILCDSKCLTDVDYWLAVLQPIQQFGVFIIYSEVSSSAHYNGLLHARPMIVTVCHYLSLPYITTHKHRSIRPYTISRVQERG